MTGIDLTPRCIELTRLRFDQEQLDSRLHVMDAERLEFEDNSFDVVYSFGVLHHTASAERAFREVRRVLRPGGLFIGSVYNRRSAFMAFTLYERLRHGEWRRESFQERLSRIEHSTASEKQRPYVRLFSVPELRTALEGAGFEQVKIVQRHSGLKLGRELPSWLHDLAARKAGWYLVHEAS
jgi:ubiquinone/menaquinone biosynthesis C-methylase UbiE